jgi:pilus assembly protein FimV
MNAQRGAVTADTKTKKPKPAAEPEPEPVPEPTPAPVAEQPDAIQAPEPTPEPSAIEAQIEAATQTDTAQVEPPVPDGAEITPPAPVVEPVAPLTPAPAPSKAPSDGGGIMGTISGILGAVGGVFAGLGGTTMIIIIGVVAVVVILLVFIMIRRRRGIHFQESILNTGANEPQSVQMDMTPSQGSSLMGGESSFLSDFAISGVSAIQAEDSEVDPLTEADVFMAYGRYEAAEERLQEAIAQDPARGELRVKLLELYNTTKNKNSFETAAEDFYAALGDGAASNPLWQKVIAMGKQIAPGNPLFRGKAAAGIDATPTTDTANLNQNDVMDIGLDTGVFSNSEFNPINTGNTANAAEAYTSGGDLDFNLDMSTNTSDTSTDGGLDFALDSDDKSSGLDFNLDTNTSGSSDAETLDSISGGGAGFDFNLNTESHTENTKMAKNASDDSMEFSLDMNAGDEPTATDIKLNMGKSSSSSMDFDLELDEDTSPEIGMDMNLDAGDAMDLDMSDTGDEVGTKLDLARAYIDMGDPDGARSILDEVMAEGNPGQKQEAQQLMSQIG